MIANKGMKKGIQNGKDVKIIGLIYGTNPTLAWRD
jgi:hypothetical protein